ncbi:MAG: class I SAM-dependent methyltransferase [Methanococcaceae archaeon]
MFYERTKNSQAHNWLIHHYCVTSVKRNLDIIKGLVLDIGCGEQPYKEILSTRAEKIIGIDHVSIVSSMSQVDVAGEAMRLPFKGESFDAVVSFQVMEHLPEPLEFLKEIRRVLKTGGHVLLTTPFMWGEHSEPYDFFRYTRYGLKYLSEKAGLSVISISPDTKYWSTAVLRFNYYLWRFAVKFPVLKILIKPFVWLDQFAALLMDKLPHNYTIDTSTFTTLLKKDNIC